MREHVFALANATVVRSGARLSGDSLWLCIGIVAGLALGKPLQFGRLDRAN